MQQLELAQMQQREANLTALAAIGPRKKRPLDSSNVGSGLEVQTWLAMTCMLLHLHTELHLPFPAGRSGNSLTQNGLLRSVRNLVCVLGA